MVIGVDFDNTIVCYDPLFHRVAVERNRVPAEVSRQKGAVRDYLRRMGREDDWTELQGYVYGACMNEARPFPGVLEFFSRAVRRALPVYIISHKTRAPVRGPDYDLHQTARAWLEAQGFFDPLRVGLAPDRVLFGTTRAQKIELIKQVGCTLFIDDLEETFLEEAFPPDVEQILFGAQPRSRVPPRATVMADWRQISEYVLAGRK